MAYKHLSMIRGDNHTFNFVFNHRDGTPYCLKDWTLLFTLKTNYDLPDSQATLQKIVTAFPDTTSGTSGSADVTLVPDDTKDLTPGKYFFDFAVKTDNNESFTVLTGTFDIDYDVTRNTGTAGT
jgi:hypothetical protein